MYKKSMLAGIVMIYTSVRAGHRSGPKLLWFGLGTFFLSWAPSMCSICAVVFVYFI